MGSLPWEFFWWEENDQILATGGDSPNLPSRENSATILSNLIKNDIL